MISLRKFIPGLTASVLTWVFYFAFDFQVWIILLWGLGLLLVAWSFENKIKFWKNFDKFDGQAIAALAVIFVPVYFLFLYQVPFQLNTDEPTIMRFQKLYQDSADIFGVSTYFNFPSFIFIFTAKLQNLLGGINLYNARLVHAALGVTIILLAYFYFRQFWSQSRAFFAAGILGANHSLVAISRMAMRDNSALLIEVLALPFLFFSLKKQNIFYAFLGGTLSGLSYYVYLPGRIIIFIWFGFLLLLFLFQRKEYGFKKVVKLGAATLLGLVLVISPILISEYKHPDPFAAQFNKERFLFNPEGRQQQQYWLASASIQEGVMINIKNGLSTFNNKIMDYGYIYPNPGHGFVDPISGMLLWVGVVTTLYGFARKRFQKEELLNALGFLGLWLIFTFIINKSPNYTRLLIILPFFAFFVAKGLFLVCRLVVSVGERMKLSGSKLWLIQLNIAGVAIIFFANLQIFGDFAQAGLKSGNDVGGTARHIESRKEAEGHRFILVADDQHAYYAWGEPWQWEGWMRVFATEKQSVSVVNSENYLSFLPEDGKLTLFMNESVWIASEGYLRARYPTLRMTSISSEKDLIAIDVVDPSYE